MTKHRVSAFLVAFLLPTLSLACSAASQSASSNNSGVSASSAGTTPDASADASSSNQAATTTAAAVTGPAPTPAVIAGANGWCTYAGKTQIAQNKLATAYAQLCANGKATPLFTQTLVNGSYSGSGKPNLTNITPAVDANGEVTAFLGLGIKLPRTSESFWTNVAPVQGELSNVVALIKAEGQTPGAATVAPETGNTDTDWVRGWTIHSIGTQTVIIVSVTTDYIWNSDQYKFADGLYMYTMTLQSSVQTMKDYELMTAGLDFNGTGYLITVGNVAVDDHGIGAVATPTLMTTIQDFATFMYNLGK